MKNDFIIVAAGRSKRFKNKTKKQFFKIFDIPVIVHTLKNVDKCKKVNNIILVVSKGEIDKTKKLLNKYNFKKKIIITQGGNERAISVYNGILASDAENVFIHDGARPYINNSLLNRLVKAYRKNSIIVPIIVPAETVRYADKSKIKLLNRSNIMLIQTPQYTERKILKDAMNYFLKRKIFFTDEAEYMQRKGHKIIFINGLIGNIKITTKEDVEMIKMYIKRS